MADRRVSYNEAVLACLRTWKPLILTVGHSTRNRKDFIGLLRVYGMQKLVDVRTIPRSRRNPQFNRANLSRDLRWLGIGFRLMAGLSGLRRAERDSITTGRRNVNFRGCADYMQAPDFKWLCGSGTHMPGRSDSH